MHKKQNVRAKISRKITSVNHHNKDYASPLKIHVIYREIDSCCGITEDKAGPKDDAEMSMQ